MVLSKFAWLKEKDLQNRKLKFGGIVAAIFPRLFVILVVQQKDVTVGSLPNFLRSSRCFENQRPPELR